MFSECGKGGVQQKFINCDCILYLYAWLFLKIPVACTRLRIVLELVNVLLLNSSILYNFSDNDIKIK